MNERFTRLFSLENNLYASGSPLIISAGALLKDNKTGNVLAQFKFRSICPKPIKAVTISITELDVAGRPLGAPVTYQYLDLSINRNEEFGSKTPIKLTYSTTRSFIVSIIEVIYGAKEIWSNPEQLNFEPLSQPIRLDTKLEKELVKQYGIKFGIRHKYFSQTENDLWICSCGTINHKSEEFCSTCNTKLSDITNLDWDQLKEDADARLLKEKEEYEAELEIQRKLDEERREEELRQQEIAKLKKKKKIKTTSIVAIVVAITLALGFLLKPSINKLIKEVERIEQEKEQEAERLESYNSAMKLIDEGKSLDAYAILKSLGDYKDADEYELDGKFFLLTRKTTTSYDDDDKETKFNTEQYFYNDNGQSVKIISDDPFEGTTIFTYNENGKLISSTENSAYSIHRNPYSNKITGTTPKIVLRDYNEHGDVEDAVFQREIDDVYRPDKGEYENYYFSHWEYEYNSDGTIAKIFQTQTWDDDNLTSFSYDLYEPKDGTEIIVTNYEYNDDGRIISETWGDVNGSIEGTSKFSYEFNEDGYLSKTIETDQSQDGEKNTYITTHEYDEAGVEILSITSFPGGTSTTEFTYEFKGTLKKK